MLVASAGMAGVREEPARGSTSPKRSGAVRNIARYPSGRVQHLLGRALTLVLALLTAAPFLWMLSGSFKTALDVYSINLWPNHPTVSSYAWVLTHVPFWRYILNTFVVAAAVTIIALLFHAMAGYSLARLNFPGRDKLFIFIYTTLLVSLPTILVPLYLVVRFLGMLNSYEGLIVPSVFNAFGIFLLRQFYVTLPKELEDAAEVDGCGYWGRFWHVGLPLARPLLLALSVFFFLANWNSFMWPLVSTTSENLWMLQEGIASFTGEYGSAWNEILAASTIAAIPTIALFALFQRQIVSSLKTSGIK